jgi:hypothetical protein
MFYICVLTLVVKYPVYIVTLSVCETFYDSYFVMKNDNIVYVKDNYNSIYRLFSQNLFKFITSF